MDFLIELAKYRLVFLFLFQILMIVIVGILAVSFYKQWQIKKEEAKRAGDMHLLKSGFKGDLKEQERQMAIHQIFAPDGIDPAPNSYLGVSDGGKEVFTRCVTISKLPPHVVFGETFEELFSFPNSTYSVFVRPEDNEAVSRIIDKQIVVLESEQNVSAGNTNRVRKLGTKADKAEALARKVEDENNKFFKIGFLFRLHADSVEELNSLTDDFRILAKSKKMDISNCYCVQSEAFLAGLPLNRQGQTFFKKIDSDCIKMFLMSQEAASVILSYTSDHFSHKSGAPLGRNLFNGLPYVHDIYAPGHFGYTTVMAGKTFSGKSATIKIMIERYVPLGYRFVIIDSQTRKGTSEGEYASCAVLNGGYNYQISSNSQNVMGLFDLQESIEFVKEGAASGYERRTLDLNSAITNIVYNLRTLIRGNSQMKSSRGDGNIDIVMDSDINDILTRITKELFAERGIMHGDADSLYEEGTVVMKGELRSGVIPKELPSVTDFFKKLIIERTMDRYSALENVYRYIINNIRENVRELYYTDSGVFFTKEEYLALPINDQKINERLYNGEPAYALKGIRPYFDGQSTFTISRDCPVTNIDISQLPEVERRSARNIALHIVDEEFVKKNSESLDKADKLVVVIDEAHESFNDSSARELLAGEVRTARKRNAGMIFSTQTIAEFSRYPETKDILEQAAVKMIFKQDVSNKKELIEPLKITDSQAEIIMSRLGVAANKDDAEDLARHRGEMCIIDNGEVVFVKVDYLKATESLSVETDASSIIQLRQVR